MRWLLALVFFLHLPFQVTPLMTALTHRYQTDPQITDLGVTYKFGEQITFKVRVQPATNISDLLVFITPQGQPTVWQKIDLARANAQGEINQPINVHQLVLFPFSGVTYKYKATLKDNSVRFSDENSFVYQDNRFQWQDLNSGIFQIHWNSNDATLGQEIANIATEGLQRSKEFISATLRSPVRIYAYSSSSDMQSALQLTSQPWVAGHASPEYSMIMISVPAGPEKKLELQRQIPHEIMHILQYKVMGSSYRQQPVWLVEGMASLAEPYINPEYDRVLETAAKSQQLLPLRSLCVIFPTDAASAFQAYAQSESFVSFIKQKFGVPGLMKLIEQYKTGVGCEEGVSGAFGISMSQLEYRWQQEALGMNVQGLVLSNLSPYLLLGLLVLVPAALAFFPYPLKRSEEEDDVE